MQTVLFAPDIRKAGGVDTARDAYRADVDGLRAVAVAAVVLFHSGVPGFSGGYAGVDVFFVISGWLITGQLAREAAHTGRISVADFYVRRVRRVVPALVAVLVLGLGASALVLLPSFLVRASLAAAAAAGGVANVFLWRTADYFAGDGQFQPFLHLWSLSVEEQFYLVVPLAMALVARPLRGRWALLFGPLVVLSLGASVVATARAPTANFYLPFTRAWELGVGSLLAVVALPSITRRGVAEAAGALGLGLVLAPVVVFDDETAFPGAAAMLPCLGAALLIHVGPGRPAVTAVLRSRVAVRLGLMSYSLYLVHWPLIALLRFRTVQPLSASSVVLVIVASLALAAASLRWVEQPFRRRRERRRLPARWRVLAAGSGALAVVAGVGLTVAGTGGMPGRFPGFVEEATPEHEAWRPGMCFLTGDPDPRAWSAAACTRVATGPQRVLVWGDSFAGHYVPGLMAHAATVGATVLQYTAAGCPPVLSYRSLARPGCAAFNAAALEVVRRERIGTVVLAGRWSTLRRRGLDGVRSTLDALAAVPGLRVVLVGQSPEFPAAASVLAFRGAAGVDDWPAATGPEVNRQLRALAGGAVFVDPLPALCRDGACAFRDGRGTFLFEDYGHLSAAGSERVVGAALLPALLPVLGGE